MSIKKVKPTNKGKYKQGYYKPKNPHKYKGEYPIIYRSSWERKFCYWCDLNEEIIEWMSEPISVDYISILDNKVHKYYPDFYFKIKNGFDKDGNQLFRKCIAEIKPKAQLIKPNEPKRKTKKALKNYKLAYEAYVRNLCKSEALKKVAHKRNYEVMFITEDSKLF